MKVYLYGDIDILEFWSKCEKGEMPTNLLYGATRLSQFGIDVIRHTSKKIDSRWRLSLTTLCKVLSCREKYDVFYAIQPRGIELLVLLRAFGLFRHPIVVWHHQPVKRAENLLRELFARFYYRGFDHLIMFSEKIVEVSCESCKADRNKIHVVHWGADIGYFEKKQKEVSDRKGMISSGKEERDIVSLVKAFSDSNVQLSVYLPCRNGSRNYREELEGVVISDNIHLHMPAELTMDEMAEEVSKSECVVICCNKTNYTVGLTTVVEALGLGIPIISSRNQAYPMDLEKEGAGLYVDYYDVDGWKNAVKFISDNPERAEEMGKRGLELAKQLFNDDICAKEVAEILRNAGKQR